MARLKALGAYIFAGGFTVGVARVFDVLAHLEETNYGVATVRHNMPRLPVHYGIDRWPLEDLKQGPPIDLLYGNPPCAAWSPAGSKIKAPRHWQSDPRVDCTRKHFGLLEDLRPKFWAWESVPQAFSLGRTFVDELTRRAVDLGYSVTYILHNAMYLGAPQKRRRFFFVAHLNTFDVAKIDWSWQTCDDALHGMNDRGDPLDHNIGKYPTLIPTVKPNETLINAWHRMYPPNVRTLNARGQTVGRPCFTIKRLQAGHPAPVVMHELIHPTEHRGISIQEHARLCGFPSDYEFIQAKDVGQISRGVCPPVGEWLARNVARCLKRGQTDPSPIIQLIDVREPPGVVTQLPYPEENAVPRQTPSPPPQASPGAPHPTPATGMGSGAYIRSLLVQGHAAEAILASVHAHYPASKATKSDVVWNRARLAKDVTPVNGAMLAKGQKVVMNGEVITEVVPPWSDTPQPSRVRQSVDPSREFDTTSLRANAHGQWVHRDYGAHFFRWGFAGRFVTGETDVLDIGCGPDVPMINALTMPRNQVPRSYVGVDMNNEPQRAPSRGWATLHWNFDFTKNYKKLGQFDLVTCFEVIEHARTDDGLKLLKGMRACLRPTGKILLSTPVFNGKAAANHLHEYTIEELRRAVAKAGLQIAQRFGTFASQRDIKKVATAAELDVVKRLSDYYSGEVLSCFLAPLYPDASRNNVWLLEHKS